MDYLPLPDPAARQLIDSTTIFDEFVRVQAQARPYAGGMYWKRQGDYEYLVKPQADGRQRRVGFRSISSRNSSPQGCCRHSRPASSACWRRHGLAALFAVCAYSNDPNSATKCSRALTLSGRFSHSS